MKTTTRKLSGPTKDRFFKRFFKDEPGVSDDLANRLARKSSETFSSVRVRPISYAGVLANRSTNHKEAPEPTTSSDPATPSDAATSRDTANVDAAPVEPKAGSDKTPEDVDTPSPPRPVEPSPDITAADESEPVSFDPYAFGLVPTMQREGEAGLLARLNEVARAEHLRAMAKAQQIVLPRELRTGDETAETLRGAIINAVSKRIADRRSAASDA
ncbi:MAG: hypothetical protein AAFV45_14820 [Pseudomonadota bacterium]